MSGRGATLAGVKFSFDDVVIITLAVNLDTREGIEAGQGPWAWEHPARWEEPFGFGGYTWKNIYNIASSITDYQTGIIIWEK